MTQEPSFHQVPTGEQDRSTGQDGVPTARPQGASIAVSLGWGILVMIIIGIGAWLRYRGAVIGGDAADVTNYWGHVVRVRTGINPYTDGGGYPYLPGWLGVETAIGQLAELIKQPFWLTIRTLIVVSDVMVCFALWWLGHRIWGATRGRWAASLYALNPIAIVISGHHGQFDAIPTLFSLIAAGFVLGPRPRATAAGLYLGLAIALKPFPILLLPLFLRVSGLRWSQRITLAGVAGLVCLAISLAYLVEDARAVASNIVGYSGVIDQGLGGLFRALWMDRATSMYLPGDFGLRLTSTARWFALALMVFTYLVTARASLATQCAALYLAFLATYGGISSQYLLWPMAWLLLSEFSLVAAMVYSAGVTAGAIGFYLVFWPQLILGAPAHGIQYEMARNYMIGQAVAYATLWGSYLLLVRSYIVSAMGRRLNWVPYLALMATAAPLWNQVVWFIIELQRYRAPLR